LHHTVDCPDNIFVWKLRNKHKAIGNIIYLARGNIAVANQERKNYAKRNIPAFHDFVFSFLRGPIFVKNSVFMGNEFHPFHL